VRKLTGADWRVTASPRRTIIEEARTMAERWVVLPEGAPANTQASHAQILAVHAALLHDGKVLYFGGSQHLIDPNDPRAARLRSVGDPRLDNTRIWDPAT